MPTAPPGSEDEARPLPPLPVVLRALREARGITREGWAARLGYGARTVQRWEQGDTVPDAAAEVALIALLEEQGLFRAYDQGPLAGCSVSGTRVADLLASARLEARDPARRTASAETGSEPATAATQTPTRAVAARLSPGEAAAGLVDGQGLVYRQMFVGREAELHRLEAACDAAVSGQGGLVLVVGEPGIGKTALTEQLAASAAARGGRTLVGHCYEEGSLSLPYLPFVEALRSYVLDRDAAHLRTELGSAAPDVARIVSEVRDRMQISPSPPSVNPAEDRYRLFNAIVSFLRNAAAVQPLVIVLEDLHDADRGTLELLTFVARQLAGARLLVVGTYRDVEVDRIHPLSATLAELRRAGPLERIALRGLTAYEVQRMLAVIAGQQLPWGLAEAVHRQTEGNPLFVQEVLRYLVEEGLITHAGGRWRAAGWVALVETIPEGLRDVIGKRLGRLSPRCNQVLAIAAVIGRDFHLATLVAVLGEPEDAIGELLDEAVKVAVLQEQARGGVVQYRFAHAFFRQTLYEELSAPRRIRVHQQVARALEQQYASRLDEHAVELAEHFAHSSTPDDLAKAVQYGEVSARRASSVYAYGEAVRLLRQAVDVQEVLAPDDKDKLCSLLLDLAAATLYTSDLRAIVNEVAPRAVRLAEELGDLRRAGRACVLVLLALARFGGFTQANTPEYLAWVERLDRLAQPGTVERVWADARRATVLHLSGRHAEAWELGSRALALARTLGDPAALSQAVVAFIWADGRPSDRQQRLLVAHEFAHLTENPADEGSLLLINPLFTLFLTAGRREDAEEEVRRLERYIECSDDAQWRLWAMTFRARLAELDGRFDEVLALGDTLLQRGEELGTPVTGRQQATYVRMMPLVYLGRAEEALRELPLAQQLAGAEPMPLNSALRMMLLAHAGRGEEARAQLQAFSAVLQERQCSEVEVELVLALITAVTLGEATVGNLAAAALAGDVDYGETIEYFTKTCTARHLGALAALQGDRAGAGARYAQALAVAARNRMRPEAALTHLALAELLLEGDAAEQRQAQEHLDLAIPEFEAMHMQPALERAHALAYRSTS